MPRLDSKQPAARRNRSRPSSNARSADLAAKEQKTAAIAGMLAAEKYGLRVLEHDIQDNAANATRFLVLGRQCSPPTGSDRTSLMVSITDKVGALHHAWPRSAAIVST